MDMLNVLSERLQDGDDHGVRELTRAALDAGLPPGDILNHALLPGMASIGERFRTREIFLSSFGTDVPAERFVDAAVESGAAIVGISALLTTTMTGMREIVDLVRERKLKDRIAIIVVGAPVTAEFAREIGAGAYASDAAGAVERVKALVASR